MNNYSMLHFLLIDILLALKREAFSSILRKEATAEDGTHFDELFEVIKNQGEYLRL